MDNKVIAIGIVAILAVAGIGSAVLLTQPGNKSSDDPTYEFKGKWNLMYMESVSLVDENDVLIHDANKCKIESRTFSTIVDPCVLEILEVGDFAFKGKIHGVEIEGTFSNEYFTYQITNTEDHKHFYIVEGVVKEKHISISAFKYGVVEDGTNERHQMCGVAYSLFVRDGEKPISPRIDWVNYHFPESMMEHVKSVRHMEKNFEENGEKAGTRGEEGLKYVKSDTMITLFNLTYGDTEGLGVLALVSLGTGPNGNAFGTAAGHFDLMGGNAPFIGTTWMSNGKLILNLNSSYSLDSLQFMEIVYNVPYFHGTGFPANSLEKEYVGTITIYNKDGVPTTNNIDMVFQQYDNTIYSKDVTDKGTIVLFGKVYGVVLDISLKGDDFIGHYDGHLNKDGTIHISGRGFSPGVGGIGFVVIDLHPKGA